MSLIFNPLPPTPPPPPPILTALPLKTKKKLQPPSIFFLRTKKLNSSFSFFGGTNIIYVGPCGLVFIKMVPFFAAGKVFSVL